MATRRSWKLFSRGKTELPRVCPGQRDKQTPLTIPRGRPRPDSRGAYRSRPSAVDDREGRRTGSERRRRARHRSQPRNSISRIAFVAGKLDISRRRRDSPSFAREVAAAVVVVVVLAAARRDAARNVATPAL